MQHQTSTLMSTLMFSLLGLLSAVSSHAQPTGQVAPSPNALEARAKAQLLRETTAAGGANQQMPPVALLTTPTTAVAALKKGRKGATGNSAANELAATEAALLGPTPSAVQLDVVTLRGSAGQMEADAQLNGRMVTLSLQSPNLPDGWRTVAVDSECARIARGQATAGACFVATPKAISPRTTSAVAAPLPRPNVPVMPIVAR